MKKIIVTAAMAAMMVFTANAGELKIRVTGIRGNSGTVMVALGDYTDMANMVGGMVSASDVRDGVAECVLTGDIDLGKTLYAFVDSNGNFNLDLGERGIPAEGCAFGPVTLDENGTATIELKYYN